jgi:hypothetical protein
MTPWQDWVFLTGSVFFAIALLPLVRDPKARVPRKTSIPTALFIATFVVAHASLGLWMAACAEVVASSLWIFVALRRAS